VTDCALALPNPPSPKFTNEVFFGSAYLEYLDVTIQVGVITIDKTSFFGYDGAGEFQKTSSLERRQHSVDNQLCIECD
jgi:hypothetical protein